MRFDPVLLCGYASHKHPFVNSSVGLNGLLIPLLRARQPFVDQLSRALPADRTLDWKQLLRQACLIVCVEP